MIAGLYGSGVGEHPALPVPGHGVAPAENQQGTHGLQSRPGPDVALIFAQQLLLHGGFQTAELVVQQHPAVLQIVFRTLEHPGIPEPVGLLPPELEPFGLGLVEPGQEAGDPLPQLSLVGNCQLGGVGGGGGPEVGHKVRDGHVRLMAHGGDYGNLGEIDHARHPLVVEGPEVLHGAAAPAGDNQVGDLVAVDVADGPGDFRRGFGALDPHRQQDHLGQGVPLAENPEHVVDGGPGRRGDNGDALGKDWQGQLVGRIEETFLVELLLQLLKGHIEVADALGRQPFAVELIGPVPGEDRDPPCGQHLHAVLRPKPQRRGRPPEHDAPDGAPGILQRKIVMSRGIDLVVADLAPHRQPRQHPVGVQQGFEILIDLGDVENLLFHRAS